MASFNCGWTVVIHSWTSFEVRAVKKKFSFEKNGKTKRTLNYIFAERQNHNRVVDVSA